MAIQILLTRGFYTTIDDEDFELVSSFKWCYNGRYAARWHEGRTLRMHRFLMGLALRDGILVDHVNGDPLDNRRANLRVCSKAENGRNRRKHANNTSGFKGVYLEKRGNPKRPWCAKIMTNGKHHSLGYYATKEEAALAYNEAARKLHGDFARLNVSI